MTNIPIEKKKGVPWWVWLLIVLLVLAGAWLLFGLLNDDDSDVAVADEGSSVTETDTATGEEDENEDAATGDGAGPTQTGPITDLTAVFGAADAASLVGRQVQLDEPVLVQSVVGDATFWVGPSQDQQVFVFLEENADAAGPEGLVDVNEGQRVLITGTAEQLPPIEQARQQFDLSEQNSATLDGEQIYLRAQQVEVVQE
jgi:hypothetical protein